MIGQVRNEEEVANDLELYVPGFFCCWVQVAWLLGKATEEKGSDNELEAIGAVTGGSLFYS